MKNLFICLTPLQALIAQALLRQSAAPADLLMLCYAEADNDKFRHYFRETAALADAAAYCVIPRSIWQRERQLPALARRLRTEYATVFAASIDNANVQYLLSRIRFARLETFDDGTANINPPAASTARRPHRRTAAPPACCSTACTASAAPPTACAASPAATTRSIPACPTSPNPSPPLRFGSRPMPKPVQAA